MSRWTDLDSLLAVIGDVAPPFDPPLTVASRQASGDTPLHVAAIWGDDEAVEMLVRAGADVNAVGDMGYTPLIWVVKRRRVEAARLLLAAGAFPHVRNEFDTTAAEEALGSGDADLISLFTGEGQPSI